MPLGLSPARKVPSFDLTFRAPKSVSVLWGLAHSGVADEVRRAHDAAVLAALRYMEEQAGLVAAWCAGAGGRLAQVCVGLTHAARRVTASELPDSSSEVRPESKSTRLATVRRTCST